MRAGRTIKGSKRLRILKEYGSTAAILIAGALILAWQLNPPPHPLEGEMAPDFELPRLDGGVVSLADHIGNEIVILDFWASWCPPCRKGLPLVESVAKHFSEEPVAVYAINIREGSGLVAHFVDKLKLDMPFLLDDTGLVSDDYGVTGIPQTVIIDKTGRMAVIYNGVGLRFESQLRSDVQALLDGVVAGE
jgi:thiol-disulfide isomerase/thioredoxin